MTTRNTTLSTKTAACKSAHSAVDLNRLLAPEDLTVIYQLDGVAYPDGLELISADGVRKLARHLNTEKARRLERWMDTVVLPQLRAGK